MNVIHRVLLSCVLLFVIQYSNTLIAKAQELCCGVVVIITDTLDGCVDNAFHPYPNPSSDGLHLHFSDGFQNAVQIDAIDANALSVYNQTIVVSIGEEVVLPCDKWENGYYQIHVRSDGYERTLNISVSR